MFDICKSDRIGIYLDYSNMHYTKYTLGWDYNVSGFFRECNNDEKITKIAMYGAYDPKNIPQFNWTKKLKNKFTEEKNYFYFKKLERKGGASKGNVDTEMGYDIAVDQNLRDCIVLFTGDGDFLYPIKKLLDQGKQVVVISTKGHIAKELIDFIASKDDDECRYIDIHKSSLVTIPIREFLKDDSRGICLPPELYRWIQDADNIEIIQLRDWVIGILDENISLADIPLPDVLARKQKTNRRDLKSTILHWRTEQKTLLKEYLDDIIV